MEIKSIVGLTAMCHKCPRHMDKRGIFTFQIRRQQPEECVFRRRTEDIGEASEERHLIECFIHYIMTAGNVSGSSAAFEDQCWFPFRSTCYYLVRLKE